MKKLLLILVLLCLSGKVYAYQNEPTGYGGRNWGDPKPKFSLFDAKALNFQNDKIAGLGVLVNYNYKDDKLYSVKVQNFGHNYNVPVSFRLCTIQIEKIRDLLRSKYGKEDIYEYKGCYYYHIWIGKNTTIQYSYDILNGCLEILYESPECHNNISNENVEQNNDDLKKL